MFMVQEVCRTLMQEYVFGDRKRPKYRSHYLGTYLINPLDK